MKVEEGREGEEREQQKERQGVIEFNDSCSLTSGKVKECE